MHDILLNLQTNDIDISQGDFSIAKGPTGIVQDISTRLATYEGEWFLDSTVGLPYFQNILVKNPNLPLIRSIYRDAIAKTPGVISVTDIELDFA